MNRYELASMLFRWLPGKMSYKCEVREEDDVMKFRLRRSYIAEFDGEVLRLFSRGYVTDETCFYLNGILAEFGHRYSIGVNLLVKYPGSSEYRFYLTLNGVLYPFKEGVGMNISGKIVPPAGFMQLYADAKKLSKRWGHITTLAMLMKALDKLESDSIKGAEKYLQRATQSQENMTDLQRLYYRAMVEPQVVNDEYVILTAGKGLLVACREGFSYVELNNGGHLHSTLRRILNSTYKPVMSWEDEKVDKFILNALKDGNGVIQKFVKECTKFAPPKIRVTVLKEVL